MNESTNFQYEFLPLPDKPLDRLSSWVAGGKMHSSWQGCPHSACVTDWLRRVGKLVESHRCYRLISQSLFLLVPLNLSFFLVWVLWLMSFPSTWSRIFLLCWSYGSSDSVSGESNRISVSLFIRRLSCTISSHCFRGLPCFSEYTFDYCIQV